MTPLAWCAPLAAASDDVLGAVVRAVCARMAPRTPGLLRIGHRREQQLVEVEFAEGGRTRREERSQWFLHIGVVFDGEAATDLRDVEDTHPALARELQAESLAWADAWPMLHRHARGDAALAAYHRTPLDAVIPATLPVHPRHAARAADPVPARRVEPEAPKPAAVVAVPEQRGLFG